MLILLADGCAFSKLPLLSTLGGGGGEKQHSVLNVCKQQV